MFHLVLFEPEIPPNTGNAIRLASNVGACLHLIEPLGFNLEDKKLRRAGLDYREYADLRVHKSLQACIEALPNSRWFACSTRGSTWHTTAKYQEGDVFLFGPETRGLPQSVLDELPEGQRIRLPMQPDNRSLNLSNAIAVIAYEAWRQLDFAGAV